MDSDIPFIAARIAEKIALAGTPFTVHWLAMFGGSTDPVTQAHVDGLEVPLSGVMMALEKEEEARTKLRQFMEIEAGDLLLDITPDAVVTLPDGQIYASGVVALSDLREKGLRFERDGQFYTQRDLGEKLARIWKMRMENTTLAETILLRRAT